MKILLLNYPYLQAQLRDLGFEVVSAGLEPDCDFVFSPPEYGFPRILEKIPFQPDRVIFMDSLKRSLPWGLENIEVPLSVFCLDSTLNRFWQFPLAPICDLILCDQLPEAQSLASSGLNAHWFPLAADTSIFHPRKVEKIYDLTFIGHRHPSNRLKRENILNLLSAHLNIKIFSGDPFLNAEQTAEVYAQSRMTLNENMFPALNLRLFEALACATTVLTEENAPGLNSLFLDGKHLLSYNPDNLIPKIKYYLDHPQSAETIARTGSDLALEQHSLEARALQLSQLLSESPPSKKIPLYQKLSALGQAHLGFTLKWNKSENLLRALDLLENSLKIQPSYDAGLALGKARILSSDFDKALAALDQAHNLAPDTFESLLASAYIFHHTGKSELAAEYLQKAAETISENHRAEIPLFDQSEKLHLFWGEFLVRKGDLLEPGLMKQDLPFPFWSAFEHFRRSAEINPRNWEKVGDLLFKVNAPDQAMIAYLSSTSPLPREKLEIARKGAYLLKTRTNPATSIRPTLSLCMIVKNEQENLKQLLSSIAGIPDQIVVVDTGSADDTISVAESFGAETHRIIWKDDFARARNSSLDFARCDYILYLDADDRIKPEELSALKNALPPEPNSIFLLQIINQPQGDICLQKRLFPHEKDLRFKGTVHEQIIIDPQKYALKSLPCTIHHYGYSNPEAVREKSLRNLHLLQNELALNPEDYYYHYHAAICLLNLDRPLEAVEHLRTIAFNPSLKVENPEFYGHAYILLARLFKRNGDHSTALKLIARLLKEQPQNSFAHYYLGKIYFEEQLYSECRSEMEFFLKHPLQPLSIPLPIIKINGWAHYYLAKCLEHQGHLERALSEFTQAQKFLPEASQLDHDLARTLCKKRDFESAIGQLKFCLLKNPQDKYAQKLLQRLLDDIQTNNISEPL